MTKFIGLIFFNLCVLKSNDYQQSHLTIPKHKTLLKVRTISLKSKTMGISTRLYKLNKAEKIDELADLEGQIDSASAGMLDLYKMAEDIAVIFLNKTDPYDNTATIPYKMLYGNYVERPVGQRIVNGFIPTSEIAIIVNWIKENKIDSCGSFLKMYNDLSVTVKAHLEEIGSPSPQELYDGYIKPMVAFYFLALENGNSIVICGE